MGRQRIWQVRRVSVPTATGQQRRDRAYQLLLQWTATTSETVQDLGVLCPPLAVVGREPDAVADHAGAGRS